MGLSSIKKEKLIFLGIELVLILGTLGLVFMGKLDFGEFLGSFAAISGFVFGLYQWFNSKEVVQENARLEQQAKSLKTTNTTLRSKITKLSK